MQSPAFMAGFLFDAATPADTMRASVDLE